MRPSPSQLPTFADARGWGSGVSKLTCIFRSFTIWIQQNTPPPRSAHRITVYVNVMMSMCTLCLQIFSKLQGQGLMWYIYIQSGTLLAMHVLVVKILQLLCSWQPVVKMNMGLDVSNTFCFKFWLTSLLVFWLGQVFTFYVTCINTEQLNE